MNQIFIIRHPSMQIWTKYTQYNNQNFVPKFWDWLWIPIKILFFVCLPSFRGNKLYQQGINEQLLKCPCGVAELHDTSQLSLIMYPTLYSVIELIPEISPIISSSAASFFSIDVWETPRILITLRIWFLSLNLVLTSSACSLSHLHPHRQTLVVHRNHFLLMIF